MQGTMQTVNDDVRDEQPHSARKERQKCARSLLAPGTRRAQRNRELQMYKCGAAVQWQPSGACSTERMQSQPERGRGRSMRNWNSARSARDSRLQAGGPLLTR